MSCSQSFHDHLKADANRFFECTVPLAHAPFSVDGAIYRNCMCGSTLALPECALCGAACGTEDRIPYLLKSGGEGFAHFGCVAERVMEDNPGTRFVIVAGKATAREFQRAAAPYHCESCRAPMERPYLLDAAERELCRSCASKITNAFAYQAAALAGGGEPS